MFYKFPRTPILALHEKQSFRGEHILSFDEVQDFLQNEIVVEEKIDGANLGISFDANGNIKLQNRGGYLMEPLRGQWKALPRWLTLHENELFDILTDRYILFGEWCYAKHSVFYDKLPDYFIAFDILDKGSEKFLSSLKRNLMLTNTSIKLVPQIGFGKYGLSDLLNMEFISKFGKEICEGIYLRIDSTEWLQKRAKIVRCNFTQSIEQHWSKKALILNQVEGNKYC